MSDGPSPEPPHRELPPSRPVHRPRSAMLAVGMAVAVLAFLSSRDGELDRQLARRFQPDPARQVVLLTTTWCGYCEKARRFLDANGVAYTELDVETSEAGARAWEERGRMGVPIFVIDGRTLFGLDVPALVEALEREGPGPPP